MNRILLNISLFILICNIGIAKNSTKVSKVKNIKQVADTLKKEDSVRVNYSKLLKNAKSYPGMFLLHKVKNDYYFEINDSLIGRDFLIVNKISGVPQELNEAGVNKGIGIGEQCIRFLKDTAFNKVMVMRVNTGVSSPVNDAITKSVAENYKDVIIESFNIEAYNADSTSVVIKVNKVFDGSKKSFNDVFESLNIGGSPNTELSKIESIKNFPRNMVIKSVLSKVHSEPGKSIPISINVTSNIVLLSKEPMKPRFGDRRVGFFTTPHLYFNDLQQQVEKRELVNRWRLEPKEEEIDKYLNGELVEPKKPIVLHIDPSTPKVWVPYIIKGVEEWQVAFEKAGFKNAIYAVEVDTLKEPDFDVDDVRYSVITYVASEVANAMGPSVIDPRSGEIIEADIIWWHNVMTILHSWIRVQTGAVDVNARGNVLPTDLMGNAIRFVSSHELGHSLGIKHNMGASYCIPVDSLRSPYFTSVNGTASSIMDYARFNYVAQPEDGVTQLTPKIGPYDCHAIEWAYRWYNTKSAWDDISTLNKMLVEAEDNPWYWYGEQSEEGIDPRAQIEDLGNDAVKASLYGLKNLQTIIPYVKDWTDEKNTVCIESGKLLMAIVSQWRLYAGHVMCNVGGFYLNNVIPTSKISRYIPVDGMYQKECVKYLINEVFELPEWLFNAKAWDLSYAIKISPEGYVEYAPMNLAREMQYAVYYSLFSDERLQRMYETECKYESGSNLVKNYYSPEEMFSDIINVIFDKKKGKLSVYERMSQKNMVDALIVSSNLIMAKTTKMGKELDQTDKCCTLMKVYPQVSIDENKYSIDLSTKRHYTLMQRVGETTSAKRGALERILKIVSKRGGISDISTANHYKDLELRIKEALRKL
jgi:hypothetical protein